VDGVWRMVYGVWCTVYGGWKEGEGIEEEVRE
jgi:hypothetical protein